MEIVWLGRPLPRIFTYRGGSYADDTTVYLNRHDLPKLRAASMEEYRLATGQRVNWVQVQDRPYRHVAHGVASRGPGLHSLRPRCIGRAASDTYHLACGLGSAQHPGHCSQYCDAYPAQVDRPPLSGTGRAPWPPITAQDLRHPALIELRDSIPPVARGGAAAHGRPSLPDSSPVSGESPGGCGCIL